MKRMAFALFLCLMMVCPAAARGANEDFYLSLPEWGVRVYLEKVPDWTVVTAENLDENMALLTARGESEENARKRFAEGTVAIEAFRPELPDGRFRLEVFDTPETRAVWHLDSLTKKQYIALAESLAERIFMNRYQLFKLRYTAETAKGREIFGSLIAYPPYEYESGMFSLFYFDGRAYLSSYTQTTEASASKHLANDDTLHRLEWTAVWGGRVKMLNDPLTPVADLTHDDSRMIVNAHSGSFDFTGVSEKGASVSVRCGGKEKAATVASDGTYACDITLSPGENEVVAIADKMGLTQNTLARVIPVDDGMAALELTEYPCGNADRKKITVKGVASQGAEVTLQIDENEPIAAKVDKNGAFSQEITAEDWQQHTLTVTAREDGLADCAMSFDFTPEYEDAKKGISAFKKTLTAGVTAKKLTADPGGYLGARVKMEVYITDVARSNGYLTLTCRMNSKKDQPVYLVHESYLEDEILPKMLVTVYGTVIEPSLTEPPVPRIEVEYIQYLKIIYKKWSPFGN